MKKLRARPWLVDVACLLLASALALLIAAWVMKLWNMHLHAPMGNVDGDGLNFLVAVKTIINGHAFVNQDIGAPYGTNFADFPHYWDPVVVALIWFLGLFTNDPIAVFNVVFILGFPFIAATSYVALRWIGTRRSLSVLGALLFALVPYHFYRGQGHLILGVYWAVPLTGALVFELIRGKTLFTRREGVEGWRGWLTQRSIVSALFILATGAQFNYYSVMGLFLIAGAVLMRVCVARSWRSGVTGLAVGAAVVVVIAIVTLPTIKYRHDYGTNHDAAHRLPQESELYGLKLTQLLYPIAGHRINRLSRFSANYTLTSEHLGEGGSTPALGFFLGASLVAAVALLIAGGVSGRAPPDGLEGLRETGFLGLYGFLLATIGGGSSIFAYLVSPQLRAWSRMSIYIAFFAVIALVILLPWLLSLWPERWSARLSNGWRNGAIIAGLCIVGALAILDMTTPQFARNYDDLVTWRQDAAFGAALQAAVPPGSEILDLPYAKYPEDGPRGVAMDYDLFKPYIHTHGLRFSYGQMRGRALNWGAKTLATRPLSETLPAAAEAGFAGAYVDLGYFDDGGKSELAQLTSITGHGPDLIEEGGRYVYFSFGDLKKRIDAACSQRSEQRSAKALLHPTDSGRGLALRCAATK